MDPSLIEKIVKPPLKQAARKHLGEAAANAVQEHVNATNIEKAVKVVGDKALREKVWGFVKKMRRGNGRRVSFDA